MSDSERTGRPDARVVPLRKPRKCPICGQPSRAKWHPFCSRRCADVDLHRWLSGAYAIPGEERPAPPGHEHEEDDA